MLKSPRDGVKYKMKAMMRLEILAHAKKNMAVVDFQVEISLFKQQPFIKALTHENRLHKVEIVRIKVGFI